MHNSALRGIDKVNELLANSNENAMFNKVRMGPRDFMILCEMLTDKGLLRPSYNMSVPEQLFVFLTIISQSQSNREAQDAWQHSGETISRRFTEVLDAICELEEEFIKPPNYDKVPKFLRANRHRYGTWTMYAHLTVLMYLAHQLVFLTQRLIEIKGLIWICYTGKYYLVDAAYANNDRFLAPYRGRTYHLPDYRMRSGEFRGPRDIFNYKHSSLRNCIERTFGVWKARFPILRQPNNTYPMDKQVKIPVACAILYNFIHMVNEGDPLLSQYDRDGVPVSEIDPNNEDEFDDDDDDDNVPEGPVVTAGTVSRTEMGRFRDRLANEMWVEYKGSRGRQV
ncbi:uncharacterized protein LOC112090909 [Morus notabilis]|uniref:uncharacterized protein LOC112090909 n=1 Tax=Morus notabilis TaxID=981085 RepID=UPI000CED0CC8|nr:uncharacterized protein LOC112090909 [Morus notabilis]